MRNLKFCVPMAVLLVASTVLACQVPVFRYALERWPADHYEIVVLNDGPLSESETKLIQRLRDSDHRSSVSANLSVRSISSDEINDKLLAGVWKQHGGANKSVLVSLYPKTAQEVPDRLIHAEPLNGESIEYLADSPLRQKIAQRLVSGESAVWIFVPCGDSKQDEAALATLRREVQLNEDNLELPEQDEIEEVEELLEEVEIELKLDFSILILRRDDPKEQAMLRMLLASEPDLEELNQPMAFPVLGRGRVLYALVGRGISEDTIAIASRFIIGPCSCQVKNQNPGFDLLMACDWDQKIGKAKLSDPLPEAANKPVLLTIPSGE